MGNLISIPLANLRPFKKKGNLSTSSGLQVNVCLNVTVLYFVVLNFISLEKYIQSLAAVRLKSSYCNSLNL